MDSATFAAVFVALYAAHQVADHWVQTEHQACTKGHAGWPGRVACAAHVASYTVTGLIAVLAATAVLDLDLAAGKLTAGLAISAATHYIADRRAPLRRLAELAGHGGFFQLGATRAGRDDNVCLGTGAYAMDQSWHVAWLFVAALVIA